MFFNKITHHDTTPLTFTLQHNLSLFPHIHPWSSLVWKVLSSWKISTSFLLAEGTINVGSSLLHSGGGACEVDNISSFLRYSFLYSTTSDLSCPSMYTPFLVLSFSNPNLWSQRLAVHKETVHGASGWFSKTFGNSTELIQALKSAAVMFGFPLTYACKRTHSKAKSQIQGIMSMMTSLSLCFKTHSVVSKLFSTFLQISPQHPDRGPPP